MKHCLIWRSFAVLLQPPQADAGWIGEAGPGPSYGDDSEDGPVGFDNEFTQRNTTFMTWNLMHMAHMLDQAGGLPVWSSQPRASVTISMFNDSVDVPRTNSGRLGNLECHHYPIEQTPETIGRVPLQSPNHLCLPWKLLLSCLSQDSSPYIFDHSHNGTDRFFRVYQT